MTQLEFGDSLVTWRRTSDSWVWRLIGQTTHEPEDSLVTWRVFQMEGKAQGPEGRLMLWWAGLRGRHKEYLSYKELRPGLVSGLC